LKAWQVGRRWQDNQCKGRSPTCGQQSFKE
jgi:hypothetical protein